MELGFKTCDESPFRRILRFGTLSIGQISTLQTDIAQQLVEESQLQQSAMANLTDAAAFVEEVRSQYLCQLTITNLGRYGSAIRKNIRIEALHAPAVTSGFPAGCWRCDPGRSPHPHAFVYTPDRCGSG